MREGILPVISFSTMNYSDDEEVMSACIKSKSIILCHFITHLVFIYFVALHMNRPFGFLVLYGIAEAIVEDPEE